MQMRMPAVKPQPFALLGGLDLKTPRLMVPPGRARIAQNYIGVIGGGYRRIGGYEAYDGQSKPSYQTYEIIYAATVFTGGGLAVGDTINGQTSGATGKVIEIGTGGIYVVVTRVTGTFTTTENIRKGATVLGVASGSPSATITSFDENRLQALTEDEYRASIAAVPGIGDILGVVELKDVLYAFRTYTGGTEARIYKETTGGWVRVTQGYILDYNTGTAAINEGDVISNGLGVTATVKRNIIVSGSTGAGNAAGYLVITTPAGGNWAIGNNIQVGVTKAVATTVSSQIPILPNGRYEFAVYNFTGSTDTERIYGCDGVNKGFEFDGTVYAPIRSTMPVDTPTHVACHKNRLFFPFRGSVQHSSSMGPFSWSAVLGASEIGIGDDVTGFSTVASGDSTGALVIFGKKRVKILYGSSTSDWNQVDFSDKVGAAAYSIQKMGNVPIFMDILGLMKLNSVQEYGGFKESSITDHVDSLVKAKSTHVVASMTSRLLNVYYIFFDDKSGIAITFGKKGVEAIMPFLLPIQVKTCWETRRNGGEMFVGADDGFVYQLERGRSFNGESVEAFIGLAFNHLGGPTGHKSFVQATIEMKGDSAFTISAVQQLSYDDPLISSSSPFSFSVSGAGGAWNVDNWDEFSYDGGDQVANHMTLRGGGVNIALNFYSDSATELPHELQGVILHYIERRLSRGR